MKRIVSLFIATIFLGVFFIPVCFCEGNKPTQSYVLMESTTGKVMSENGANDRKPVAALTKMMTLALIGEKLESGELSLSATITAPSAVTGTQGSVIWLTAGEKMAVSDLLKALIIGSANDAAITFAGEIGGSVEKFIALMNEKARELGMNNTVFENCTGLDSDGAYSTAYDMALLGRELVKYEVFREYMLTWMSDVRNGETMLVNNNLLVKYFNGIQGLMAGSTEKAGYCICAAANNGSSEYIAVVLGNEEQKDACIQADELLEMGFANFSAYTVNIDEKLLVPVEVLKGTQDKTNVRINESISVVIAKGEESKINYEVEIDKEVTAPVLENQTLGKITVYKDYEVIYETNVVSSESVPKMTLWVSLGRHIKSMFSL